ncbi:hypothetical protein [Shinella pollutisoli]|uniref:Initiator Replication protein n=1 Tax=Shinella pollutisoli TaxID=2250594 RepID=A0ABV7DLP8_9HYPH|nr:hypothetical protein [Shinella pollutisoli]
MQYRNAIGQLAWSSRNEEVAHRARDRRGIRAGDLVCEAVADNDVSNPRVEIPFALTKGTTFRVVEGTEVADRLTSTDQALWYYLFTRAKVDINSLAKVGSDGGFRDREAYRGEARVHKVTVGDMLAYLGLKNPARLRESLERIAETMARYDIRYRGTRLTKPVPYLTVHSMPERLRSRDEIGFELHPEVRVCMLLSRKYVTVDLNALPTFKSRYSARLFVKLSYLAARHQALLRSKKDKDGKVGPNKTFWVIDPEALAAELGYPVPTYRASTFAAAMTKAIAEIQALPKLNQRFDVLAVLPTARVPRFSFAVTEARKSVFDVHRAWLKRAAFYHATAHTQPLKREKINMKDNQFVHVSRIAQAEAFTGYDGLRISMAWQDDIEEANAGIRDAIAGWTAAEFLERIDRFGVDPMFASWLEHKVAAWNIPEIPLEPAVVAEEDAVHYSYGDEDEEDTRCGDEWGDIGYADAA